MDPQLITVLVLIGIVVALVWDRFSPEVVMFSGLAVLLATGVLDSTTAFAGFSRPSVITLGALFVVGAGLQSTGALEYIGRKTMGRLRGGANVIRLTAPVTALSAFVNNTPIVTIFMPIFVNWAKRNRLSPSRVLIPLSYAAMVGGTCTLIGTSTNLVVHDELTKHDPTGRGLAMFETAWLGVPVVVAAMIYLHTIGRRLLPEREDLLEHLEANPREYSVELVVGTDYPMVGSSVRKSGLRDLPGLYLYRIERQGIEISPVAPSERIRVGDVLHFSGIISTVVDLQKTRGLAPVEHRLEERRYDSLDSMEGVPIAKGARPAPRRGRKLCEVVISNSSPLVGLSVRDSNFRAHYNASILAVHRTGEKLQEKIGQTVLKAGDTLLIDADEDFTDKWRNSLDFVLIAGIEGSAPVAHERTWLAMVVFVGVVLGMTLTPRNVAAPAVIGAVIMVLTRCVPPSQVARSIELPLLMLIGAAYGVGSAMEASGTDKLMADSILGRLDHPLFVLSGVFLLTSLLSQFLSNNATAVLMSGIAAATAAKLGLEPRPYLIAVALAASTSFATPIGYQTNLIVRNAGGYRFIDYVKVGLPLTVMVWAIAMVLIPVVWGFPELPPIP